MAILGYLRHLSDLETLQHALGLPIINNIADEPLDCVMIVVDVENNERNQAQLPEGFIIMSRMRPAIVPISADTRGTKQSCSTSAALSAIDSRLLHNHSGTTHCTNQSKRLDIA